MTYELIQIFREEEKKNFQNSKNILSTAGKLGEYKAEEIFTNYIGDLLLG